MAVLLPLRKSVWQVIGAHAWEAISGAYVILSGLGCCASPGWQALTGKGEIGRARAHEKGHARRGKFRLRHNDMYGNLCCDHLILLFLLKRLQYKGLQDKLQELQS